MSVHLHHRLLIFISIVDCFIRADSPRNLPTRRYHPTTFYSGQKDQDTAADDIQYAYEGGESHTGEVTNQDSDYQESNYQPEVHNSYQTLDAPQDSSFSEGHDYSYHYDLPEHGYPHHEPSGYHYLPPPPALPALTTPRPLVETPKQTPPQYTYYYLGRHLWYIPLYFSIYFIIYVGALVLKSVARHKIQYPYNLQMAAAQARTAKALDEVPKKFYM